MWDGDDEGCPSLPLLPDDEPLQVALAFLMKDVMTFHTRARAARGQEPTETIASLVADGEALPHLLGDIAMRRPYWGLLVPTTCPHAAVQYLAAYIDIYSYLSHRRSLDSPWRQSSRRQDTVFVCCGLAAILELEETPER
jgi:hypothetical protein